MPMTLPNSRHIGSIPAARWLDAGHEVVEIEDSTGNRCGILLAPPNTAARAR